MMQKLIGTKDEATTRKRMNDFFHVFLNFLGEWTVRAIHQLDNSYKENCTRVIHIPVQKREEETQPIAEAKERRGEPDQLHQASQEKEEVPAQEKNAEEPDERICLTRKEQKSERKEITSTTRQRSRTKASNES